VTRDREEDSTIEYNHVDVAINRIGAGHEYDFHHNELGVSDEKPGHDGADDPADILWKTPRLLSIAVTLIALKV
jgi:hypothetical protein